MELSREGREENYPMVGFLLESPRDPAEYTDDSEAPPFGHGLNFNGCNMKRDDACYF